MAIFDDAPKKVADFCEELLRFGLLAHVAETVEVGNAELLRRYICRNLVEEKVQVFESQVEAALRDNVEDRGLVVALRKAPEKSHDFVVEPVFLQQQLQDLIGPLDQLCVGLSSVPNGGEDVLVVHPFDELVGGEGTGAGDLVGGMLCD